MNNSEHSSIGGWIGYVGAVIVAVAIGALLFGVTMGELSRSPPRGVEKGVEFK